jgi:shikimate kinase
MINNIVLIGFMGVGKSTLANFLEKSKNMKVVDIDYLIEEREGLPIQEIFSTKGEPCFRELETNLLKKLVAQNISNTIISCGGGIVLDANNLLLMEDLGVVVQLIATPETIYQRIRECKNRPILSSDMSVEYIKRILDKRQKSYDKASTIKIETDGKTIEEVCGELLLALDRKSNEINI